LDTNELPLISALARILVVQSIFAYTNHLLNLYATYEPTGIN